ncbi:MAG: TonB-dependent receptor [candidate division Zixibacteria bacterium]|nr:TonB-dependent receptor [candidate division Zixibacteria bacterium]
MHERNWQYRRVISGSMALSILVFAGCGGGTKEAAKPAEKPATQTQAPAAKPATARLAGQVVFKGEVPKSAKIQMDADPVCKKQHSTEVYTQEYIVGSGGELANVFIYVKSGLPAQKYPVPSDTLVFDQRGCEYYPHVFGMRAGQPLAILNSDPTLHNIHAMPTQSSQFNMAMPKQGMRVTKTFEKPEVMVKIKCDVHAWMSAYAGVLDHPFFAVTGPDGRYSIGPLPPGTYELEAWHEKLGTMTASVTVGENETKETPFTFGKPAM